MSNKTIWTIIIAILAVLIVAGIVYWQITSTEELGVDTQELLEEQKAVQNLNQALENTTFDVENVIVTNPLEKLPETNPVDAANPFKNLKTNPFRQ